MKGSDQPVTQLQLHQALAAQDAKFDSKLDHSVAVLEQKIERNDRKIDQVRIDLMAHIDKGNDRVVQAMVAALAEVPSRTEFSQLERRVSRLETKG